VPNPNAPAGIAPSSDESTPLGIARAKRRALAGSVGLGCLAFAAVLAIATGWNARWAIVPALLSIGIGLAIRHRARLAELDRAQALQAQLSLHRIGETLARFDREEDLVRHALDAVAEGMGIGHWALYAHRGGRGEMALAATRGLNPGAEAELTPDPPGPEALSPASRAAWLGEIQVGHPAGAPSWRFPASIPGLGPDPVVVSVPFAEHEGLPAVLQCFLPAGSELTNEQRALLRWMASQLASGLRRLRMERRDQLLASYLMGTSEILLELDLDGVVAHANRAAERALAAPPGALLGSRLDDIAPDPAAALETARATGEFSGELRLRRGDDSTFPAEVRLSLAYDRAGALTAMMLVGRDIEERRDREEEISARGAELALMNQRLLDANHALEQARRLQNDFLANMSHELRTPLNAVIGFATLLEQQVDASEDERIDFARSIREAAEHLLLVINDLLDLAKAEAGRFQLQLDVADVRPAIRAAAESIGPIAAAKRLSVGIDVPPGPLPAAVDLGRFRQVLLNLLGNAVKFTDRGGVRVRAWLDGRAGTIVVSVEDTGVGIAPDRRAALFSKFAQADPSYTRRQRGTGLGLAISRALVECMGGSIRLESEGPNRGTQVRITLPAALEALAPMAEEAESCGS
jgi:PAS domain S-box-containing protein